LRWRRNKRYSILFYSKVWEREGWTLDSPLYLLSPWIKLLSCRYPLEDEEKEKEISRSYVAEIINSWKTWNPICAPLGNRIFKVVKGYKLGR
jgi:hypothetical protein